MDMDIDSMFGYMDYISYSIDPQSYIKKHGQMNIQSLNDLFHYLKT